MPLGPGDPPRRQPAAPAPRERAPASWGPSRLQAGKRPRPERSGARASPGPGVLGTRRDPLGVLQSRARFCFLHLHVLRELASTPRCVRLVVVIQPFCGFPAATQRGECAPGFRMNGPETRPHPQIRGGVSPLPPPPYPPGCLIKLSSIPFSPVIVQVNHLRQAHCSPGGLWGS